MNILKMYDINDACGIGVSIGVCSI